jgi:hypothetical protein
MEKGSLFCFVVLRSTKWGCFELQDFSDHVLDVIGKLSMRGVCGLGSMMTKFKLVVQKFLNIE